MRLFGRHSAAVALALLSSLPARASDADLTLRTADPGARQFLVQPAERAVLQGYARQSLEAYVYPFQILRDYRAAILGAGGRRTPLSSLRLSTAVYPDSIERTYRGQGLTLSEHWVVPLDRPGVILIYRLRGGQALTLEVSFRPVLNLMWPGAIDGPAAAAWNGALHAFVISEPSGPYRAYVGSPQAQTVQGPNSAVPLTFTLRLTPARPSAAVAMSLSVPGHYDGVGTYRDLLKEWSSLQRRYGRVLSDRIARLSTLDTPDVAANRAFRWAEIALEQAWVCNPELGCGLVAGYGPTRGVRRPQYEWFFGGDGLDAVRALDAVGDMPRVAAEFAFLRRYQNARTGMMWHELSQSAGLIDWSKYPYEYLHPDVSMDYLATAAWVWLTRADRDWLTAGWPSFVSAHRYILSLRDPAGIPLIPVGERGQNEQLVLRDELSMSLSMLAAENGYVTLAGAMGDRNAARAARADAQRLQSVIGARYWNDKERFVAQGFQQDGRPTPQQRPPIDALDSAAFTPAQQEMLIERLLRPDFLTAWGIRSLPTTDAAYDPTSYASGSVWPAANAAFAIALWKHHRDTVALHLWKALVAATFTDAPGHIAEVFSGRAFRVLDVAVPAQTFSSAGFVTATVQGLLGYHPDAPAGRLQVAPHLPVEWARMGAHRLPFGNDPVDLEVAREAGGISLRLTLQHPRNGTGWTVVLPATCGDGHPYATADGHEVGSGITERRGHSDVTAQGRFGAAPTVIVRVSCR
jgi:Mannosylglycerate hydrolase MGH1-like glycoside hydrolase domain